MAALGNCPAAGNLNTTVPYISINEITTVAAAYALAGFATDSTHIGSSGTALAQTGIANAFLNATNLVNLSTGAALATTPAGNGTVPQNEILTLANILGSCVNSNDANSTISSNCSTLFGYALSAGTLGTTPTDTASAAINIAHNPGTNIANLFKLPSATPPYAIRGTYNQPNDFTITIAFTGGGISNPYGISVDANGDVWTPNIYNYTVSELSALGTAVSPATGYIGGGLSVPYSVGIDRNGNVWIPNENLPNGTVTELSPSGSPISPSTGYSGAGLSYPTSVAIDGAGNVWAANYTYEGNVAANPASASEISSTGVAISPASGYTGGGLAYGASIALDGSGNAWVADIEQWTVSKLSNNGTPISPAGGYTGGGLSRPRSVEIDSASDVWTANYGNDTVSKFSNAGIAISSANGFGGAGLSNPSSVAIDGDGTAWTANPHFSRRGCGLEILF